MSRHCPYSKPPLSSASSRIETTKQYQTPFFELTLSDIAPYNLSSLLVTILSPFATSFEDKLHAENLHHELPEPLHNHTPVHNNLHETAIMPPKVRWTASADQTVSNAKFRHLHVIWSLKNGYDVHFCSVLLPVAARSRLQR